VTEGCWEVVVEEGLANMGVVCTVCAAVSVDVLEDVVSAVLDGVLDDVVYVVLDSDEELEDV